MKKCKDQSAGNCQDSHIFTKYLLFEKDIKRLAAASITELEKRLKRSVWSSQEIAY